MAKTPGRSGSGKFRAGSKAAKMNARKGGKTRPSRRSGRRR